MIPAESPKRKRYNRLEVSSDFMTETDLTNEIFTSRTHLRGLEHHISFNHTNKPVPEWPVKSVGSYQSGKKNNDVDSPSVRPNFKMAVGFEQHLFKPSKSSPYAHITLDKSSHNLHNISSASTSHTSHVGSSFTESFVSSGGSKATAMAHDRMADFCDYDNVTSSPACDDSAAGVVGLSALSNGINEFAKNNANMQQKLKQSTSQLTSSSASAASCNVINDGTSEDLQSDVMMLLGHDDSFISSISATSSPRSFCRDDGDDEDGDSNGRVKDLLTIMAEEDEKILRSGVECQDRDRGTVNDAFVAGQLRRGTAIQLFEATPPSSPVNTRSRHSAPSSPSKSVAITTAAVFSSLESLNTPVASSATAGESKAAVFLPSTYNNNSRPLIACDPPDKQKVEQKKSTTRKGNRFILNLFRRQPQPYSEPSPDYHQDNISTLATNGDGVNDDDEEEGDVDASILRLEEAASSSCKYYSSCEEQEEKEFCENDNGYGCYFMSEDDDAEDEVGGDEDFIRGGRGFANNGSTPPVTNPNPLNKMQHMHGSSTVHSHGPDLDKPEDDEKTMSITSSPLSGYSTTNSTPSRSRKRAGGGTGGGGEKESNVQLESNGPDPLLAGGRGYGYNSKSKHRRHSHDAEAGLFGSKRYGIDMTGGPGIFDSPNKKTSNSYIFIGNDSYDDDNNSDDGNGSRHHDRTGGGNESDISLMQSFPRLLSSSKRAGDATMTLPPLPFTPFAKKLSSGSGGRRHAPHTISHPSRDRDRDKALEGRPLGRKGSLNSHDWQQKMLGGYSSSSSPFQLRGKGRQVVSDPGNSGRVQAPSTASSPASSVHSQSVFGDDEDICGEKRSSNNSHVHELFDDYMLSPARSPLDDSQNLSESRFMHFPQPDFTDESSCSPQRSSDSVKSSSSTSIGTGKVRKMHMKLNRSGSVTRSGSLSRSRPMPDQGAFDNASKTAKHSGNRSERHNIADSFVSAHTDDSSDSRSLGDSVSPVHSTSQPSPSRSARKAKADRDRDTEEAAPVCPPTPERTERAALWVHIDETHDDAFYDASGVDTFLAEGGLQQHDATHGNEDLDDFNLSRPLFSSSQDDNFRGNLSIPLPMRRQNSLVDTKILASSNVPRAPRSFGEEEKQQQLRENGPLQAGGVGVGDNGAANTEKEEHTEDIVFDRDFVNKGIIGSGTFAEVFKCTLRNGSHESFAIKKSRRQFRSKRDRADLLSEVHIMQIVGATECPYLIQFYRAWQENSYFYVQIELAERGTLRDLMASHSYGQQAVQDKTVLRVLHDVASGLEHIHQCGVVHLDIKPQNILISLDGTVKIGDFGIAMAQGTDGDEGHEGDTRYLPQELLNSTDRHYSADIFSLGLTLYEVCLVPDLDVLPYSGELWHDLREGRSPPLTATRERSEGLVLAIASAMSANPCNRPSATDLLHCPCMQAEDFSVPCAELLGGEMLPPSPPNLSRSNSFCPMMINNTVTSSTDELEGKGKNGKCSTPSSLLGGGGGVGGAAYRNFVSPPPMSTFFHPPSPFSSRRGEHNHPPARSPLGGGGKQSQRQNKQPPAQPPRTIFKPTRNRSDGMFTSSVDGTPTTTSRSSHSHIGSYNLDSVGSPDTFSDTPDTVRIGGLFGETAYSHDCTTPVLSQQIEHNSAFRQTQPDSPVTPLVVPPTPQSSNNTPPLLEKK